MAALSGSFINECYLPDLLDVQQTFSLLVSQDR